MKKFLLLPVIAMFAASPALAQSTMSPQDQATGDSKGEQRNVIEGAKDSSAPGATTGPSRTDETPPGLKATGDQKGAHDNVIDGAMSSGGSATPMGDTKTEMAPPNKQATGDEGKDDNRLPK